MLLLQIFYPPLVSLLLKSAGLLSALDLPSELDRWNYILRN
jgi:hypothetical protein